MNNLDEDLLRAAEILEREAMVLFKSFTVRGKWASLDESHVQAKRDRDECLRLAKRFRRIVGTL